MNKYLMVFTGILLLMVIDQLFALRRLSSYNQLQEQTISDYWEEIQKCREIKK